MRIFHDIDGGRITTSPFDVGSTEGVSEALIIEIAANIGGRRATEWQPDYEKRGGLQGVKRSLKTGEVRTLNGEESKAAVEGLRRLAFPERYDQKLPAEFYEEGITIAAGNIITEMALQLLDPPNE